MLFYRCPADKKAQNMTQFLHPAAEQGFSTAAELYQQVRPSYPQALVAWLKNQLKSDAAPVCVDLGAGTGKFLPILQQLSPHVIAVEPVAEMLAQLQQHYPDVQSIQAYSHALPLPDASVDAVCCAQSFHWFANLETLNEIYRVLKLGGQLLLIWNQRDTSIDWVKALAEHIALLEGDTPRFHSGQWRQVFSAATGFNANAEATFQQWQSGTVEQVVSKRLLSTSFIAALPEHQQQQLKQQFEQIVLQYTGKQLQQQIDFPYLTHVYSFTKITEQ